MSYVGSTPTTQNFIAGTQQFTGNGSSTNWTLSRFVNSTNDIQVTIANVVQNPASYSVSGNTLTISPAVSNGVVFYVRYLSTTLQSIAPGQGTVGTAQIQDNAITTAKIAPGAVIPADLSTGAPTWDTSGNLTVTGNVRTSNLPAIFASRIASGGGSVSSGTIVFNNVYLNNGSNYSASTGLFTCPLPGLYLVTLYGLVGTGGTANNSGELRINKGAALAAIAHWNITGTPWESISMTAILSCAVNDTISASVSGTAGGGFFYGGGAVGGEYNGFSIAYLG